MATFKPGRLKRTLTPITGDQWQFTVTHAGRTDADDTIHQIVITRGTNGRNTGHHPTTCEVSINARGDGLWTRNLFRVFIRNSPAESLAAYVGTTAAQIATRFRGRLAGITVQDTGRDTQTTYTAASLLTRMNYSAARFTPNAGDSLGTVIRAMTYADNPVGGIDLSTNLGQTHVVHHATDTPHTYRDGMSWISDIGLLVQDRRDGSNLVYSHITRASLAASRATTQWPLMRNQAISPMQYEQRNERPAMAVDYAIHNSGGGLATRTVEIPTGEAWLERKEIDWSRWRVYDNANQLYYEAYAQVFESNDRVYHVPSITVDLLMLLRDGGTYARRIARQILMLEVGEPVMLSGDWPLRLRGVHFAEGIKETITPDEWTFELSLVPHRVATGQVSPVVRPRAWDSFTYDWNTETRTWSEA